MVLTFFLLETHVHYKGKDYFTVMLIPQSTLLGLGSPISSINSVLFLPPAALDPVSHSGAVFWPFMSLAQQAAEVACGNLGSSASISFSSSFLIPLILAVRSIARLAQQCRILCDAGAEHQFVHKSWFGPWVGLLEEKRKDRSLSATSPKCAFSPEKRPWCGSLH